MYFCLRSERELRNIELPSQGCPGRPGHGMRLVIIEYHDVDEFKSHDTRGTSTSKLL